MKNILTIDLEEWFHANYHDDVFDNHKTYEVRILQNTERLLSLFEEHNAKATFFALGYVAEKHPRLIQKITDAGHEIASHGYAHQLVYQQTPSEFRADVRKAKGLVEDIIGKPIKGYRAPSWSITSKSLWAWEILQDLGFDYDASVFPIQTYLYGLPSAPRFTYHPKYEGTPLSLLEVPSSTIRILNKNIPFAGGFYFRVLPYIIISQSIRMLNKEGQPAIVYLHPREIDPEQPRLNLSVKESLIHYFGVNGCEKKLTRILKKFELTSIEEYYEL
ncbi:polysaccharide deactylase family protein, PEP-CTERM locus subfamily [Desulfosporosinus orientis DSM 765]|uniref:Polysaccharide deactylase family protein, PEP-CTERM locus subfamily n=1 Tax=Desulfosporosinus orientis (strain ATCC 19365 / DSM 765 / NCIMB 8382 / VKM B-1628 / Singapore I) TaxID=768706 RepID=G7WC79_DESOD|nr:XrtA system polysaccharide deacetylase [Desulfosporosinus orientis]AET70697.1 polysaccharide deactylase family protein, PEP-CTERM locus subfamily [Desulfosporosinus orientis DSM 765]